MCRHPGIKCWTQGCPDLSVYAGPASRSRAARRRFVARCPVFDTLCRTAHACREMAPQCPLVSQERIPGHHNAIAARWLEGHWLTGHPLSFLRRAGKWVIVDSDTLRELQGFPRYGSLDGQLRGLHCA